MNDAPGHKARFAEHIGSTRINISRWENGSTIPSLYYRQKLAELFGKNIQELGFVPKNQEEHKQTSSLLDARKDIYNSINTQYWYVPHRRNPFFTGRDTILQQIHTTFSNQRASGLMLALSGLGGMGKTQIAIEYAYRYQAQYQAIFWLNASTQSTLSSDFTTLAPLLGSNNQQNDEEVAIQVVKHWLANHAGWLLILDGLDTPENISTFLPTNSSGDILLTTRLRTLGSMALSIEAEKMRLDEGMLFLLRRTHLLAPDIPLDQASQENQELANTIVNELEGLPLALDQAAAYIEETRSGLSQYLDRYNTHRKELLLRRGNFPINHPDPVATTWRIAFQQVEQRNPASADLLHLCAFFDASSIPAELLSISVPHLGTVLNKVVSDPFELDNVLESLQAYSLIHCSSETGTLTMHRLVQMVLRQSLPTAIQKQWARRVIQILNHAFSEMSAYHPLKKIETATWSRWQRFIPQVQECVQLFDEYTLVLPEAGYLFTYAGNYAYHRAMYEQAELFFQRALAIFEQLFPADSPLIAVRLNYLGELYRVWGRYPEAEPLFLRALTIHARSASPNSLDVASTLNNLGELYHNLGRYKEAEPLFQRSLSMLQQSNESDDFATITTLHHLARLYHTQKRYAEAEPLYRKVLSEQRRLLGPNHFEIAIILSNLAGIYRTQGNYIQAETLLKQALEIEEELLGPDDPHTATALHNLAVLYQKQQRYVEAETHFQRALTIKEEALGPTHLSTVTTMSNLGYLYQVQKHYEKAEVFFLRALEFESSMQNHPYMVTLLRNIGRFYHEMGNYEKAEAFYLRALKIGEQMLPSGLSTVIGVLESLAKLYEILGRKKEEVIIEQHIVELRAD